MSTRSRFAVMAGGVLAVLLCAGFGGGQAAPVRGSVQACTAFGVRAIEHHFRVTSVPPACQGLTRAEINFAISRAIYEVAAAGQHKIAWRRRAAAEGTRLARLITSLPPGRGGPSSAGATAAAPPPPPDRLPLGLATLAVWLAAAASGGYIAARRIRRGGLPPRGPGQDGAVRTVVAGHAGLAVTGLLVWASFLASGQTVLAWLAAALLLPVTGLGIATITLWTPGARPGAGNSPPPGQSPGRRGRPGPLAGILPVVHGLAAMAAILLALLTAVG